MGEDENYELCIGNTKLKEQFPDNATFPCYSSKYNYYDVTIYATPCDGKSECRGEADEKFCDTLKITITIIQIVFVIMITVVWISSYIVAKKKDVWEGLEWNYEIDSREGTYRGIRGNDLVRLKVKDHNNTST